VIDKKIDLTQPNKMRPWYDPQENPIRRHLWCILSSCLSVFGSWLLRLFVSLLHHTRIRGVVGRRRCWTAPPPTFFEGNNALSLLMFPTHRFSFIFSRSAPHSPITLSADKPRVFLHYHPFPEASIMGVGVGQGPQCFKWRGQLFNGAVVPLLYLFV